MPLLSLTPPVLQLHPTRTCNLRCLHCYSSSAPSERHEQDLSLLAGAVADAAAQGYRIVSISGGEPLLYSALPSLLAEARRQSLHTTVTTNGLLLDDRRIQLLAEHTDFLAISLDGVPERHNYMRNAPRAFETMCKRLNSLRCSGIPFGFLFTLTHENIDDIAWVAEFAASEGAQLLQIHPLEEAGRAQSTLVGKTPTDVDAAFAWLLTYRLNHKFEGRLKIHLDFLKRDALRNMYSQSTLPISSQSNEEAQLADFISPLVVESDGTIVPLQYGFHRKYALGNLNDVSLMAMAHSWLSQSRSSFDALCSRAADLLPQRTDLPFVNWYELVANVACELQPTPSFFSTLTREPEGSELAYTRTT